jgi:hypothetical protein
MITAIKISDDKIQLSENQQTSDSVNEFHESLIWNCDFFINQLSLLYEELKC